MQTEGGASPHLPVEFVARRIAPQSKGSESSKSSKSG